MPDHPIQLHPHALARLRAEEWDYDSLSRILQDELPTTMTLGLLEILVVRMVHESVFTEPVQGLLDTIGRIAADAEGGE